MFHDIPIHTKNCTLYTQTNWHFIIMLQYTKLITITIIMIQHNDSNNEEKNVRTK